MSDERPGRSTDAGDKASSVTSKAAQRIVQSRFCGSKCLIPVAVCSCFFANFATMDMGVAVVPTFLNGLHMSNFWNELQLAAKPACQVISNFYAGSLVDRGNAQTYLLLGTGGLTVTTLMMGLSIQTAPLLPPKLAYAGLLTARCLQGGLVHLVCRADVDCPDTHIR